MKARWEKEIPILKPELIAESAEQEWRKTSFDGGKGEVISIAWALEDGEIGVNYREQEQCEKEYLAETLMTIEHELKQLPPMFIGHNIVFDLQFLFRRCVVLGVKPPFKLPFTGRHGTDYYDNMVGWCGYKDRISQDNLAKALGLKGKPDSIDGSKVWDFYKAGKIKEIAEYNIDDVDQCRQIYNRINFRD